MPSFTNSDVESAAKDAEIPDHARAERELLNDIMKVPQSEQLDFLKAISKQTQDDHNANSSLPTLEITNEGAVQKLPSVTENLLGGIFYNPDTALSHDMILAGKTTK